MLGHMVQDALKDGWGIGTQQSFKQEGFAPRSKLLPFHPISNRKGTPFVYLPSFLFSSRMPTYLWLEKPPYPETLGTRLPGNVIERSSDVTTKCPRGPGKTPHKNRATKVLHDILLQPLFSKVCVSERPTCTPNLSSFSCFFFFSFFFFVYK